jgi:hypothetical protein
MMEGSSVEFFSATAIADAEDNPAVLDSTSTNSIITVESHAYFADESMALTNRRIMVPINKLQNLIHI